MATQLNVHTVFLFPILVYSYKVLNTVAQVTFSGKLTSFWMHLSDQTLMRKACFFFSTESICSKYRLSRFLRAIEATRMDASISSVHSIPEILASLKLTQHNVREKCSKRSQIVFNFCCILEC